MILGMPAISWNLPSNAARSGLGRGRGLARGLAALDGRVVDALPAGLKEKLWFEWENQRSYGEIAGISGEIQKFMVISWDLIGKFVGFNENLMGNSSELCGKSWVFFRDSYLIHAKLV